MMRRWVLVGVLGLAACGGTGSAGGTTTTQPTEPSERIVVLTAPPTTDAGLVPRFEWEAYPGATSYRLAVLAPSGLPIWSWEGEATAVYLGGLPVERPPGMRGPVIEPGAVWSVVALDSTGSVVAASGERPVSPGVDDTPVEATTTTAAVVVEIGDPCALVAPAAVAALVGDSVGEASSLVVGGDLLGRTCAYGGGLSADLTVGIFRGGASSFVDRCEECEPYPGLGDAAWGGVGVTPGGQPVGYLYVEAGGLTFTAETFRIEVSLDRLEAVLRSLTDG